MRRVKVLLAIFLLGCSFLYAQDRSESPYFLVESSSGSRSFPLLSTEADVTISGPIADVRVVQKYRNDNNTPIEAVYVFPASTRAAVYHMEMHIGSRVVKAQIMERQQAAQTYEAAKQEGKRASLLEQERPNVFQMRVANIMPGEQIDVHMYYTEFLLPEEQVYSFVYPTVVGPRYNGSPELTRPAAFASMPYTKAGEDPMYAFDISVQLSMPVPITHLSCTTHKMQLKQNGQTASILLDPTEKKGGNKDMVIKYSLAGNEIASGVLTYAHENANYFLCQLEAPKLSNSTHIVPREYIFILDVSGSMSGFPLDVSKELIKNLLSRLRPSDKFNVLFFAGSAFMLSTESMDATKENVAYAFHQFQNMDGGGGTNLLPALRRALGTEKQDGYARTFVIATDGYVTVEEEAFELIRQSLSEANFFAFGIGSSVNRHLIEGMAHVGRGEPFIVLDFEGAAQEAVKLGKYIEHPVLTSLCIEGENVELYDIIPEHIPDLMAARPIYFFGKYKGNKNSAIKICGNIGNTEFVSTLKIPVAQANNSALRYLWAREKIRFIDDFNALRTTEDRIYEMVEMGLEYNLLTRYTSFVAVDHDEVANADKNLETVKQPLPMPQGVPNSAVGFELQLEEIVSHGKSQILQVDVICEHRDLKILIESVLEVEMKSMSKEKLLKLRNTSITLRINESGTISVVKGDKVGLEFLVNAIEKALNILGQQAKAQTVTIRIGEQLKLQ